MSTRCQLGFYEPGNDNLLKPDALLYRHSDGDPGTVSGSRYGVLTDLVPFLKAFQKRRGLDNTEAVAAWTLHHLIDRHIQLMKEVWEKAEAHQDYFPNDGKDFMGHGISKSFHADIAYYYAVQGATVRVYEVHGPVEDAEPTEEHFRLLRTVRLTPKKRYRAGAAA